MPHGTVRLVSTLLTVLNESHKSATCLDAHHMAYILIYIYIYVCVISFLHFCVDLIVEAAYNTNSPGYKENKLKEINCNKLDNIEVLFFYHTGHS